MAEVIDLFRGRLGIAAPVVHLEHVLVLDPGVGIAPGVVVSGDLDAERQRGGVRGPPEPGIEEGVGDLLLLEVTHAHPPVHPGERRREAVALLAVVVAVAPERAPVEKLRRRDLEEVVLREAAVALQSDGPAPERPTPERVLSHLPSRLAARLSSHLPGGQDREWPARSRVAPARAGRLVAEPGALARSSVGPRLLAAGQKTVVMRPLSPWGISQ